MPGNSFAPQDMVLTVGTVAAVLVILVGAGWGVFWKIVPNLHARFERTDAAMAAQFARFEKQVDDQFAQAEAARDRQFQKAELTVNREFEKVSELLEKAETAHEAMRTDVSLRRHDLANKMQLGFDELNGRIDVVKDQYARREEFNALTASMNGLTTTVISLGNIVSRFEGLIAPLLATLPRTPRT